MCPLPGRIVSVLLPPPVQAPGLLVGIYDGIGVTCDDRDRQPQLGIVRLKQSSGRVHAGRILCARASLGGLDRDFDREPGLEAGRNGLRLEHVPEDLRREQMSKRRGTMERAASPTPGMASGADQSHISSSGWIVVAGQQDQAP